MVRRKTSFNVSGCSAGSLTGMLGGVHYKVSARARKPAPNVTARRRRFVPFRIHYSFQVIRSSLLIRSSPKYKEPTTLATRCRLIPICHYLWYFRRLSRTSILVDRKLSRGPKSSSSRSPAPLLLPDRDTKLSRRGSTYRNVSYIGGRWWEWSVNDDLAGEGARRRSRRTSRSRMT